MFRNDNSIVNDSLPQTFNHTKVKSSKSDYNENGLLCKFTAKHVLHCNSRHCFLWVPHRHATMDSWNPTSPSSEQTGPHVAPCQKMFCILGGTSQRGD